MDVRGGRANDRVVAARDGGQAEHIGRCAVEHEIDGDVFAKMTLERINRALRVGGAAVGQDVAVIGSDDRLENIGVDAGVVVAGKAAMDHAPIVSRRAVVTSS